MNYSLTGPLFSDYDTYHMLDSLAVESSMTVVFHVFPERSFLETEADSSAGAGLGRCRCESYCPKRNIYKFTYSGAAGGGFPAEESFQLSYLQIKPVK
jgi:hypothetical protein